MGSHIQFPKLVLKQFADRNNSLHYYSFPEGKILPQYPRSFNAVEGYYQDSTETLLNKLIETPLGRIVSHLQQDDFHKECPIADTENHVKDYVSSLLSRNPDMLERADSESDFSQLLPEYGKHDYTAIMGVTLAHNNGLFDNYNVGIGTTEKSFVLNSDGMVQYGKNIICPISPQRAFILIYTDKPQSATYIPVMDLTEETDDINIMSFRFEQKYNNKFIIAESEEILNELIQNCRA